MLRQASWLISVLVLALLLSCTDTSVSMPPAAELPLQSLLGGAEETAGFAPAGPGRVLHFPEDHAAHPAYRHEWWYVTGNLQTPQGKAFGFQLTLFRLALKPAAAGAGDLSPGASPGTNPWLDGQVYLGHFAITAVDKGEHRALERISRAGPALAGATLNPPTVWLGDWRLQGEHAQTLFPMQLQAADRSAGIALNLHLRAQKPRVLQGEQGWSQKNPEGGGSYYYSYTRLEARGSVDWDGEQYSVTGAAWYDHEWSSNSLASYQRGWDWFALQLDDGRELMVYRFRDQDQSPGWSQAVLVKVDGVPQPLSADDWSLEILDHWRPGDQARSAAAGAADYPSAWRLRVPAQQLDLRIQPKVADQEMRLSVRYWEGAVEVSGSHPGQGYVELVGY